eukprot:TRINITY_DN262_c0_g1_i1.p1 TRINITY_DN262_c0_g1~~TRINITY_DN262_c0_g1_i1.p1  ORF type:complete len:1901 (-),score=672.46 TRINITY_DN262_c0_g1_i1:71-5674(-)
MPVVVPTQLDAFTAPVELSLGGPGQTFNTSCAEDIAGGCHTLLLNNTAGGCTVEASIGSGVVNCTLGCAGSCVLQLDGDDTEPAQAFTLGVNLLDLGEVLRLSVVADAAVNVTVRVWDQDGEWADVVAHVQGLNATEQFDFVLLEDFAVNLNLELVGTIEVIAATSSALNLQLTELSILDQQRAGIGGHVFQDCACDGQLDPGDTPLGGVEVQLAGCGIALATASDASGAYRFADLAPCALYTVSVEPRETFGLCAATGEVQGVLLLQNDTVVNFASPNDTNCAAPNGTITGSVVSSPCQETELFLLAPIFQPGVEVTLEAKSDNCSLSSETTVTDDEGRFSFAGIPACKYIVSVDPDGRVVCPDSSLSYEVTLLPDALINRIRFSFDAPLGTALDALEDPLPLDTSRPLAINETVPTQVETGFQCDRSYKGVFGGCHNLKLEGIAVGSCRPFAVVESGLIAIAGPTCDAGFELQVSAEQGVRRSETNFNTLGSSFRVALQTPAGATRVQIFVTQSDGGVFVSEFNTTASSVHKEYIIPFEDFVNATGPTSVDPTFQDVQAVSLKVPQQLGLRVFVDFFGILSDGRNIYGRIEQDCDCNGDGLVTSQYAEVPVHLSGCGVFRNTTTSPVGSYYSFVNLPACASYVVSVDVDALSGAVCSGGFAQTAVVASNTENLEVNFYVRGTSDECAYMSSVQGRVLLESGCEGEEVRPASGVQVLLTFFEGLDEQRVYDTTTNDLGQYLFTEVPGNTTVLVALADRELDRVCPNKATGYNLTLEGFAEQVTDVDFALRERFLVAVRVDDFVADLSLQLEHVRGDIVANTTCDEFSGGQRGAIIGGCHTGVLAGVAVQACYPSVLVGGGVATCSNGDVCSAVCTIQIDGQDQQPTAGLGLNSFPLDTVGTGFRVEVKANADALVEYRVHDEAGLVLRMPFEVNATHGEWVVVESFFREGFGIADLSAVGTIDLRVEQQRELEVSFRNWDVVVPAADIFGVVFGDCNCDTRQGSLERGVANVTVVMRGSGEERTTWTNEAGEYFFVNLLPGDYEVEVVSVENIAGFCEDLVQTVTVFGEGVKHDIGVTCLGSIRGFTYSDRDCRGVREAGSGLEGVSISAIGQERACPGTRTVTSKADGSYALDGLVPCTYEVVVPADSEALCPDQPKVQRVVLGSGEIDEEVDFRFSARANIIGSVFASPVCDRNQEAVPLPSVAVNIRGVSRCPIDRTVNTNADGAFSIGRLAPCTYTVTVETEGGVVCPLAETSFEIVLLPGVTRTNVDFLFIEHENSFGSISGSVYLDDQCNSVGNGTRDTPLSSVLVSFFGEDSCPEQLVTTNTLSDGTYLVTGLPPCTYTVTIPTATGTPCPGGSLLRRVTLAPAATVTGLDFPLVSQRPLITTGALSGRVLGDYRCDGFGGEFDEGIAQEEVFIVSGAGCGQPFSSVAVTNDAGYYEFDDLEACPHTVSIRVELEDAICARSSRTQTVDVVAGGLVANNDFVVRLFVERCDRVSCDDGDECTVDTCDPRTGACSHEPVENCGRPELCGGSECRDDDRCTVAECNAFTGYCEHPFADECFEQKTGIRLDDVTIDCSREHAVYHYSVKLFGGEAPEFFQMCIQPSTFVSASPLIDVVTGQQFCTVDERVLTSRSTGLRGLKWDDCAEGVANRTLRFDLTIRGFYDIDLAVRESVFVAKRTSDRSNFDYLLVQGPYDCDCAGEASEEIAGTDGTCVDYLDEAKCADSTLVEISVVEEDDDRRRAAVDEAQLEDLFASLLGIARTDLQIEVSYFRVGELIVLVRLFDTPTKTSSQLATALTVAISSNDPAFIGTPVLGGVVNIVDLPSVVEGEFTVSSGALTAPAPLLSLFSTFLLFTLSFLY